MIISRLDGGLGNQMFQYAYGLFLARKHRTELALDISSYEGGPQHGYLLDQFQISAQPLTDQQTHLVPPRYRPTATAEANGFVGKVLDLIPIRGFTNSIRRHKESHFGFDENHLEIGDNRYLVGYWQSEKFFPGMRARLLEEFRLRDALSPASQKAETAMLNCRSIAVHVRRGDYIKNPAAAAIYESLSRDYYLNCVAEYRSVHPEAEVFVFSNDMDWCQQNLNFGIKTHHIDHNGASTAHEDMWLMSRAACCVIANSTFSWWAAWLNPHSHKTIFAPQHWFRPGQLNGEHILCSSWLRREDSVNAKQAA